MFVPLIIMDGPRLGEPALQKVNEMTKDMIKTFRGVVRRPKVGSVVYCDFWYSTVTPGHSGIYVGRNKIVSLNGHGEVEEQTPEEFIRSSTDDVIYVSCRGEKAVGKKLVADMAKIHAKAHVEDGMLIPYSLTKNNCHKFVCICLGGYNRDEEKYKSPWEASNELILLSDVEKEASTELLFDNWRIWDR